MIIIKKVIILFFPLLLLMPILASAESLNVITDNNTLDSNLYYSSSNDEWNIDYKSSSGVAIVETKVYSDSGYSNLIAERNHNAPSGQSYVKGAFRSVAYYDSKGYTASNSLLFHIRVAINEGDLVNPEIIDTGNTGGDSSNDCSCKVLGEIKDIVASNSNALDTINSTIGNGLNDVSNKLEATNTKLSEVLTELRPKKQYTLNKPKDISKLLDESKPKINLQKYENNTEYFKDNGDETTFDVLPSSPDIKEWDGYTKENEINVDTEQILEKELTTDTELSTDTFTQDNEISKDSELSQETVTQDSELSLETFTQDSEIPLQNFTQDTQMTNDPFQQTEQFTSTNGMNQTHFYSQTNIFP